MEVPFGVLLLVTTTTTTTTTSIHWIIGPSHHLTVLNDILNEQLDAETPAVVLSSDQFQCMRDNSVLFSEHCRCLNDEKMDVCFCNGDVIHIGSNLKSICFSKSFDVAIEKMKINAFFSLVSLKDIKMHHDNEKMFTDFLT